MTAELFARGLLVAVLLTQSGLNYQRKPALAIGVLATLVAFMMLPTMAFIVLGSIFAMLLLAAPLYVTIAALTLVCFYFGSSEYQNLADYQLLIEKVFTLTDKHVLLAIPFFVVAGSLMTAGGIARRIINFADALVGWLPGGMAAATVCSCLFFAAISGSSPVTVIAIGSVMLPALVERGYDEHFSLGLVSSAGSLGILIPPSIPMIIYAIVVTGPMRVDVADLFVAGLGPGALIGLLFVGYAVHQGIRRPDFRWSEVEPPSIARIARSFIDGIWALMLPVIVLGGIYPIFGPTGLFTPTEAAAISAMYAFLVERFVHGELDMRRLPSILAQSALMMGGLLIIMILSFSLNHFFVERQIPEAAVAEIAALELTRFEFLILLNLLLLAIGCLMDIISAVLVVAPLLAPVAHQFGIDPVHLAVIFVVNLEIGYLTPPIGMNLFVSASLFQRSMATIIRAVIPFTLLMLAGLVAITWYEPISLAIVRGLSPSTSAAIPQSVTPSTRSEPERPTDPPSAEARNEGSESGLAPEIAPENEPQRVLTLEEIMKQAIEDAEAQPE